MNFDWQLYVIIGLAVLVGMIAGMLIKGDAERVRAKKGPSGGALRMRSAGAADKAELDNGYDHLNPINRKYETVEICGAEWTVIKA